MTFATSRKCKYLRNILYLHCICTYVSHTFNSSISSSILILYRSISFDQLTVELLLLSFHGGISSSIVAKKEDNSKVECKERRYSRPAFISSISSSILIFHRSISFDLVTVEFLLLSIHGGISSCIVAKKEEN